MDMQIIHKIKPDQGKLRQTITVPYDSLRALGITSLRMGPKQEERLRRFLWKFDAPNWADLDYQVHKTWTEDGLTFIGPEVTPSEWMDAFGLD